MSLTLRSAWSGALNLVRPLDYLVIISMILTKPETVVPGTSQYVSLMTVLNTSFAMPSPINHWGDHYTVSHL